MNEDEFVGSGPELTQRWTYRMLCGICSDIKEVKREIREVKEKKNLVDKSLTLGGGFLGGVAAWLGSKVLGG